MKAGIYLRVSTEEQRERQSIETQRDFACRYCALHETSIFDFYVDDGVSGTVPVEERPGGARMLEHAREHKFDAVLVYKLDRLGRDPRIILNTVDCLESLGLQIRSMTEPFDTSSPSGRFMLTVLSGVAGLERDTIIERSIAGTYRLARAGAWLGGIVPYGYRVAGSNKDARLEISEESLPGVGMSEADVVRRVYHLSAGERRSSVKIAAYLNSLGVPPSYVKDGRTVLRGKRKQATAGIWRPSRVSNLITSTTYRGVHQYGKRSERHREIIERQVPAIVSVEVWEQAQQVLHEGLLFSPRNANHQYLLRGLIKCDLCGLTFIGTSYQRKQGGDRSYYKCNGRHQARGVYGLQGKRCPSKPIGGEIDEIVWTDVEGFLRNPGEVLQQLGERLKDQEGAVRHLYAELAELQQALEAKEGERDAVIGLYRRGRIDELALGRQLDQLDHEEAELKERMVSLKGQVRSVESGRSQLQSTEDLLRELNQRLDEPLSWELKRQLVEALVGGIVVRSAEKEGQKEAVVDVTYRFPSTANCTGRGSWPRST